MMSLISMLIVIVIAIVEICLYIINGGLTTVQIYLMALFFGMILNEACLRFECKYWNDEKGYEGDRE